jgi:hypothetical protein
MKHLLTTVAIAAVIAAAAPAWAQGRSGDLPGGRNTMGMPGPNPGGPSAIPNTTSPPAAATTPAPARRKAAVMHRRARTPGGLTGDTANQLNAQELARIQSGSPPPMAPMAPMPPPQTGGGHNMGMPGPNAGGPGASAFNPGGAPPPR